MKKGFLFLILFILAFSVSACSNEDDANTLVVGMECAYAPFDWTTSNQGDHTYPLYESNLYADGYDVDVARYLADQLDMTLVIKKIEWTGLIPALQNNVIDVIISSMSPTDQRKESVLFSDEYYRVNTVMIVKKDGNFANATNLSDFEGAKVIAQQDTIQDNLIDQINNVNHLLPLAQTSELVINLTSGVSDALVTEAPVARTIVQSNPNLKIIEFTETTGFIIDDSLVAVATAVRLGETDLINKINTALANLDLSTRSTWMDNASSRQSNAE